MAPSNVTASWADAITFAHVWQRTVNDHGDRCFCVFEAPDGFVTEWTYDSFDDVVERMAAEMVQHGVGAGTAVHLALTNSPTFVAVWLAAVWLGAWIVPSDPMGKTPELADHVARTDPVLCFGASARADVYGPAAKGRRILWIDETDTSFGWLPQRYLKTDHPSASLRDRAAVMFTSGTTGKPKGVEITQANYAFAAYTMAEAADLTAEDRQIVVLPLFHANAQYYSFAPAIWVGASVALMHTFSASGFLPQCARHQVTCASLFAAPIRMILSRGQPLDGVMLRHCWFAQNISAYQHDTISDWFGCRPRQLYGMTETIPAVLSDTATQPCPQTLGSVTAGCEVDLHDDVGTPISVDAEHSVGEIVVRGEPGITLFAGYLGDPETTSASFIRSWFRTGDRARRRSDGRFVFDGRRSDVLKVAGENVSVTEIEAVLGSHLEVLEACVVGRADPIRDEVPVAFVVPADPSRSPAPDDLIDWCRQRLAKAKVPVAVTLLEKLPRTSVGKIRKFDLKRR